MLGKVKALVTGAYNFDAQGELEAACVPVVPGDVDCRTCAEPCDQGHEEYPARFKPDMDSLMLGSVKPYCRMVVISTGKADWDREVTDVKGTLASFLSNVSPSNKKAKTLASNGDASHLATNGDASYSATNGSVPAPIPKNINGVFTSSESSRVSILNGSHKTLSHDDDEDTVLVFPDYKLVSNVPRTMEGASGLFDLYLDPHLGQPLTAPEKSPYKSWTIPYSCVILLCSHKKRDNKCHIAAGKLEHAFLHSLQERGWHVDTHLEHPSDSALEDLPGDQATQDAHVKQELHEYAQSKKALVIKNSHTGGHKYAGNCIIYTPQGSGVWYGRVSSHEVQSIVEHTLEGGKVLPPLLRGGVNIARPGCKSLNEW